jgi:hypothetical protein
MAQAVWQAWEPAEWVATRGNTDGCEGEHFVVRWGAQRRNFSEADALRLLAWCERAWSILADSSSPSFFLIPYSTPGWNRDGLFRKLNVYVTGTGLAPCPGDAAYAHQGTHVERLSVADAHPVANIEQKLHHSYLALTEDAALSESTVCHELTHVLQMHSGGHVGSDCVGWQWEAHAEYGRFLCRRDATATWVGGIAAFLDSSHLPPGATRVADDGSDSRQYAAWPFMAWLDRRFGPRTAHRLWAADWEQRCAGSGRSVDMLTNLASHLGGWRSIREAFAADWALAVATAHFADGAEDEVIRASCDVLSPSRFAKLRRLADGGWRCSTKPLKQHGVCVHRLQPTGAGAAVAATVEADDDDTPLCYALVAFNAVTGERIPSSAAFCGSPGASLQMPSASLWQAAASAVGGGSCWALLLAVSAAPDQPQAVPWSIQPSSLRSFGYSVRLAGCEPHAHSCAPADPPLISPSGGLLAAVPTGLRGFAPCDAQPGASLTDIDLRSGEPGSVSVAWLSSAVGGGPGRLRRVRFSYRYVTGYSGNEGEPGPRFQLIAAPLGEEQRPFAVLYSSPEFAARPHHYDPPGGHPRNYSAPAACDAACDVALPAAGLRLGIRFVNGVRNLHLQGGGWPATPPLDLQLAVTTTSDC